MDAKKLKSIIKSNITETAMLDKYLMSRGIQPKFATKDMKVAHSKSNQFKKWLKDHAYLAKEEVQPVEEGVVDAVKRVWKAVSNFDDPSPKYEPNTRRRLADKKKKQQNPIKKEEVSQNKIDKFHKKLDQLVHSSFGKSSTEKKMKEEVVVEDLEAKGKEILARHAHHHAEMMKAMKSGDKAAEQHHHNELNKAKTDYASHSAKVHAASPRKDDAIARDYKQQEKERGIGHVRDSVEVDEEPIQEARMSAAMKLQRALERDRETTERQKRLGAALTQKSLPPKNDAPADSQTPKMTQEDASRKSELSKSARIIKSLYKKKGVMKEETYDHEKADKAPATYGKKPKFDQADPKDSKGENKPQAAAVLSGGTTLTGQKRDDIEIDPMMRARPGQPDPTKKKEGDKDKDDKKKDK